VIIVVLTLYSLFIRSDGGTFDAHVVFLIEA